MNTNLLKVSLVSLVLVSGFGWSAESGIQGMLNEAGQTGDRSLLTRLHQDAQNLIDLGRLGQQKASNPTVKKYAASLVAQQQQVDQNVQTQAQKNGVSLPSNGAQQASLTQQLEGLTGKKFDAAFLKQTAANYLKGIGTAQVAQQSPSTGLQSLAGKVLPTLQSGLQKAEALAKQLG